jgi:hypothetical protein
VPQDECKLRNLLTLLAKLKQCSFAGILIQEVGNIRHCAAIVLGNVLVAAPVLPTHVAGIGLVRRQAAIVLLLLLLLRLALLLLLSGCSAALLRVMLLLMHPGRVAAAASTALVAKLVMSVDMRRGHHLESIGSIHRLPLLIIIRVQNCKGFRQRRVGVQW